MKLLIGLRKRPVLLVGLLALGLLALGLAIGSVGVLVDWLSQASTSHHINPGTFKRIREDLTEAEVEEMLGVPPGEYSPGRDDAPFGKETWSALPAREFSFKREWRAGRFWIIVNFDKDGRSMSGSWESSRVPPNVLDTLRRIFGL